MVGECSGKDDGRTNDPNEVLFQSHVRVTVTARRC